MAEQPKNQSCSTCRYYQSRAIRIVEGITLYQHLEMVCKVRSPTLATRADPGSGFPITESYNWCGEYAPDKPETVEDAAVVIARQVILGDMTAARGLVDKIKELQT